MEEECGTAEWFFVEGCGARAPPLGPSRVGGAMMLARYAAVSGYVVREALGQFFDALGYTSADGYTGFDEIRGLPIVAPGGVGEYPSLFHVHRSVS